MVDAVSVSETEFRAKANEWFMPERHPVWVAGSPGALESLMASAPLLELAPGERAPLAVIRPFRPMPQIHHDPEIGPTAGDRLQAVRELAAEVGVDRDAEDRW